MLRKDYFRRSNYYLEMNNHWRAQDIGESVLKLLVKLELIDGYRSEYIRSHATVGWKYEIRGIS